MADDRYPLAPDPAIYTNMLPAEFAAELADAQHVGLNPATCPSVEFDLLANTEPRLVYVVTEQRALVVAQLTFRGLDVRHSVLAGGRDVLAAGEISLVDLGGGTKQVLDLTHQSGHYQPHIDCLHVAADVLRDLGFEVLTYLLPPYHRD
jgi:hypothetical protein